MIDIKVKTYTKKEIQKIISRSNKASVYTDEKGDTHITILFPFRIARGKWVCLTDGSITSAETMRTDFRMSYLNHTVSGDSQEDCLLKIIACLTGELMNDKKL